MKQAILSGKTLIFQYETKGRSSSLLSHHYTGEAPPEFLNLAHYCLAGSAQKFPDKTALIAAATSEDSGTDAMWSYGELEKIILTGSSALLKRGIMPGERLLIRLDNTADYAFLFLPCRRRHNYRRGK